MGGKNFCGAVSAESSRGLWQYNSPKENCRRDCKLRAPHPVTSNQHRRCSSRAHPRDYPKTKPRGRSRCTSTHGAPRNKSRGRLDRTLVLGCCGAAAQNAGGRPGLPLTAPDTVAGTCPRGTTLRQTTPGTKKSSQPRAGVWTSRNRRVKRTKCKRLLGPRGYLRTHAAREDHRLV